MKGGPQICGFYAMGRSRDHVLSEIGTALLQVKSATGSTLADMADRIGKSDDQLARYIAGDMEMGVVTWLRVIEAWPDVLTRLEESAEERALRSKQRPLDLELKVQREKAA
jgi:transcriptional regulator with XRE-family HTH domain